MKRCIKILVFLLSINSASAQTSDTWTHMNDFVGDGRSFAISFVVNNKAYVGTGITSSGELKRDFWQYDPVADTWNQKAFASGVPRYDAVGFAIGNKGYMGGGDIGNGTNYSPANDFYEYDPVLDVWNIRNSIGFTGRRGSVAFVAGGKGYVTTGYGFGANGATYDNTLWEYDPATTVWTQRPSFPGYGRDSGGAFSINNVGYVTGGQGSYPTGLVWFKDLWAYDPALQQWSSRANYSTDGLYTVEGFSIGSRGYVVGLHPDGSKEFLEYNSTSDAWTSKSSPASAYVWQSTAFNLCNLGYFATGGYSKNAYKFFSEQLNFSGPGLLCSSNTTFSVGVIAPGSTITWSKSSNIDYVSGQSTSSYTAKGNSTGAGWVRMDVTTPCGSSYYFQHDVWVGSPVAGLALDGSTLAPDYFRNVDVGNHTFTVFRYGKNADGTNTNVNIKITRWPYGTITNVNNASDVVNYNWVIPHTGETYNFQVTTSNACGSWEGGASVSTSGMVESVINKGKKLKTHPNPASSNLTIELTDDQDNQIASDSPYELSIFDRYSRRVYAIKASDKILQVPVNNLPSDIYYLNIVFGDIILKQQIIVSH